MQVGFELGGARRIAAAVHRIERQVRKLAGQVTKLLHRPETTIRAQLDESLAKGGKAQATTFQFDPVSAVWSLTTRTVTIREPGMIAGGEAYDSGAICTAKFYQQAFWIDDAPCANIN